MKNNKIKIIIFILLMAITFILFKVFINIENVEPINEQIAGKKLVTEYDITTLGTSTKDKIYEKYDTVKFGRYYQDALGLKKTPIEWIILDKKDDKVLLFSKYILDSKSMTDFSKRKYETHPIYHWGDSDIRGWLNNDFCDIAFNNNEKRKIKETELKNIYEEDTKDKVFLLSEEEFREYFKNDMYYDKLKDPNYDNPDAYKYYYTYKTSIELQTYDNGATMGTSYALKQGLNDYSQLTSEEQEGLMINDINISDFRLRSQTSADDELCSFVRYDNKISCAPADYICYGIRPAIWVSLK